MLSITHLMYVLPAQAKNICVVFEHLLDREFR